MRGRTGHLVWVAACVFVAAAYAQEGHPLSGTWSGDWGPAADKRTRITLVMEWNGKAVVGTINPGPEAVTVTRITVDYAKWTVRLEADKRLVAEGRIDDLGSWHRTLSGTWTQGGVKGTFKLTRD